MLHAYISAGLIAIPGVRKVLAINSGRVMAVDDEVDIVFVIRRYLERWGYSVDTFSDPLHAFQVFKQNPDRYSLALLDIRMPEMTGVELANRMLKIKPTMNIVIMTAYEIEPSELATNLPMIKRADIIRKPFSLVQICDAVKKQLRVRKS